MTRAALSPRPWLLLAAALALTLGPMATAPPALAQDPLDAPFGRDGTVTTAVGSGSDHANGVALQSDGKIVAAGRSHNGSNEDFAVVRYHADGSLDTGFGTGGKITTAIGAGNEVGNAVAVQSDGKIVVAGYSHNGSNDDFALARYNANGSLDTGFGGDADGDNSKDGWITTPLGSGTDRAHEVAVLADGKILLAGLSLTPAPSYNDFALARYNADGSLGTGFGTGGKVVTPISSSGDYGYTMLVQPGGKIVVAGESYSGSARGYDFSLARFTATGALDTGFGSGGKVITDMSSGDDDQAWGVALQSDGKIVLAGESSYTSGDIALARYNTNGSLDTTFGTGGMVTTAIGIYRDKANAVAVQSDGKIVVVGYTGGLTYDLFALVRYDSEGSLDTGFGSGGKVTTEFPGNAYAQAMAIQPDGRIVAAGYYRSGSTGNIDFALARYNSDGTLDAPAPSTTIALEWTPALAVKNAGGGLGCSNGVSGAECSSASVLPSDRITYTRMIYGEEYTLEYRIVELYLTPEGELVLTMDQSIPPDFTLTVEERGTSVELPVAHATLNYGRNQARWRNTGLQWYAGWPVSLGMRRPLATLDTVYVHWDDDAQGDFTEYGIANPTSYGLGALVGGSATHVKLAPRVAHAGSTVRVGRVTYDGNRTVNLSPVNDGEQSAAIEFGANTIIEVEVTEEGVVKTYLLGVSKAGGL